MGTQPMPCIGQVQPTSTALQVELQPSPLLVLWSSQTSRPATSPSPQVVAHGCPGIGQVRPGSGGQAEVHPSPLFGLPSSQASEPIRLPSPHPAVHTEGSP